MEDFTTVLWVVIIAGIMVFNVVSQARKARGKEGHASRHGEAWPTIPPEFPASESSPQAPRPAPQPVTPAFPDEYLSLEEIPAREYEPEFTTQKAAASGHFRHQTVNRLKGEPGNDEIAAHALTNDAPETEATAIAEDFDLRTAVIYSEILKPKFGE